MDPVALTYEQALEKLQQTVKKLEGGETQLEQSLKDFEEGMQLARLCQEHLNRVEKRIEVLTKVSADGDAVLKPFDSPLNDGK